MNSIFARTYAQGKVSDLAKNFSRRPGNAAENYIAYGMTQKLFEACSTQADYKIPQASQKGAEVPKTETGEDLGVGESWWYKGESIVAILRWDWSV
jgi:cytochrome b pre-mRNA-processing protein 3